MSLFYVGYTYIAVITDVSPDKTVMENEKGEKMLLFLKVFFTEFIAEMGDKTQLMLIALTSKYKLRDIILGTAAAILVLNGLGVLAGGLVSEFIPDWLIKIIAAAAFLYFAASTIAGDDDDEEEEGSKSKIKFAPLAVFCTFFIAELGDKTQLTTITFGANEGMGSAFVVWIGCSLGLFAADILGMLVGYLLKSKCLSDSGIAGTYSCNSCFCCFMCLPFYKERERTEVSMIRKEIRRELFGGQAGKDRINKNCSYNIISKTKYFFKPCIVGMFFSHRIKSVPCNCNSFFVMF